MVHGWAMQSGIWGGLVDALACRFRVHLVDLPGHGVNRHIPLSRDIHEVTDLILSETPPAIWLGWSLGGLIALAAALRQPGRVKKAILVAATPCFSKSGGWDCGVDVASQRAFRERLDVDFDKSVREFWFHCFGDAWVDESLSRLGKSSVVDKLPSKDVMLTGLHLLYDSNLLDALGECEVPTLFVGGTRDRTIKPESFARAAALMPAADCRLIRGAGHAPFISHQEKVVDMVLKFYEGDQTV